jgi:hypothetical protein
MPRHNKRDFPQVWVNEIWIETKKVQIWTKWNMARNFFWSFRVLSASHLSKIDNCFMLIDQTIQAATKLNCYQNFRLFSLKKQMYGTSTMAKLKVAQPLSTISDILNRLFQHRAPKSQSTLHIMSQTNPFYKPSPWLFKQILIHPYIK